MVISSLPIGKKLLCNSPFRRMGLWFCLFVPKEPHTSVRCISAPLSLRSKGIIPHPGERIYAKDTNLSQFLI